MTDIKCLDSSAWLAYYFAESEETKNIIESVLPLITSTLSLFEIKKRLLILKKDPQELLEFIKNRSRIQVPDTTIVEKAAELALKYKLGAIDALIYATSVINNAELFTGDNDFRSLEKVKMISVS